MPAKPSPLSSESFSTRAVRVASNCTSVPSPRLTAVHPGRAAATCCCTSAGSGSPAWVSARAADAASAPPQTIPEHAIATARVGKAEWRIELVLHCRPGRPSHRPSRLWGAPDAGGDRWERVLWGDLPDRLGQETPPRWGRDDVRSVQRPCAAYVETDQSHNRQNLRLPRRRSSGRKEMRARPRRGARGASRAPASARINRPNQARPGGSTRSPRTEAVTRPVGAAGHLAVVSSAN